jgi:hypothetical protein
MATSRTTNAREERRVDDDSILFRHDWADGTELGPSITDAVARLTDTPPERVGSDLRGSVDPDGLERVFHPSADGATREGGRLVVPVESCVVTVESDGWVSVVHRPEDG